MKKKTIALLAMANILIPNNTHAFEIMSAACSEPEGVRYDQVRGKTQRNNDGFSGSNPQFIFSRNTPTKLTVIWPDSKTLGSGVKQQAHEATIVDINETMISAVVVYERQRINLYTLFPSQGIAFMSTHKTIPLQGGIPSGALFKMECKFEFS